MYLIVIETYCTSFRSILHHIKGLQVTLYSPSIYCWNALMIIEAVHTQQSLLTSLLSKSLTKSVKFLNNHTKNIVVFKGLTFPPNNPFLICNYGTRIFYMPPVELITNLLNLFHTSSSA